MLHVIILVTNKDVLVITPVIKRVVPVVMTPVIQMWVVYSVMSQIMNTLGLKEII